MKGFLLGLVVAGLGFGGYVYWKQRLAVPAPAPVVAEAPPSIREGKEKKKRRRRGATRVSRVEGVAVDGDGRQQQVAVAAPPLEPEPIKLSASDLKMVGQGDDLSRPDVMRIDAADNDTGTRELGQDEIDTRFRAREDAILACIFKARPDEETYVPGRVTVKFRIQRTGTVRGVRVEAPAVLHKGGLYGCVKGVVMSLRFPPSNGSQVVSYPFSLT
jgi:hypothetical protein